MKADRASIRMALPAVRDLHLTPLHGLMKAVVLIIGREEQRYNTPETQYNKGHRPLSIAAPKLLLGHSGTVRPFGPSIQRTFTSS